MLASPAFIGIAIPQGNVWKNVLEFGRADYLRGYTLIHPHYPELYNGCLSCDVCNLWPVLKMHEQVSLQ